MKIQKVMNREIIAESLHDILNIGREMLKKDKLEEKDRVKLRVIKTMAPSLTAAVDMAQLELGQQRLAVIVHRMGELEMGAPKELMD